MIKAEQLCKSFDGNNFVFKDLSFQIATGAICSFVGPSGCGKTTLLNILAGLDESDSGSYSIDSNGRRSSLAYMMQDALLLPWRTLAENAWLGKEVMRNEDTGVGDVDYYFDLFDLHEAKKSYPIASSAGMKQRVALIRTLLVESSVLFLDEPFTNLDFDIKLKIQRFLIKHHERKQTSVVIVTHDIEDAIALSDKVIVLSDKPTKIKAEISIDLGLSGRDPVNARRSSRFSEYFARIWDDLKYLKEETDG